MSKTIVTHLNPDLDAIASVWLLTRFGGREFQDAKIVFVPAGERLSDTDNQAVHVDTGLGEFDHHQPDVGKGDTCAARLVYEWLVEKKRIQEQEALTRLVSQINEVDHFHEYFWSDAADDRYDFFLEQLLDGLKLGGKFRGDAELLEFGMRCLDGVFTSLKNKVAAEEELRTGITFETKWGKTIALETGNDSVMKLALKSGYRVVVRRDPESGAVRVKAAPLKEINLSEVYKRFCELDPQATWFFHPSGTMILNGSMRNPKMRPTTLTLVEVIEILKRA